MRFTRSDMKRRCYRHGGMGTYANAYMLYDELSNEHEWLCEIVEGQSRTEEAQENIMRKKWLPHHINQWNKKFEAFTSSLEGVRAAQENGEYKGLIKQDHVNLLIERWGNRPSISDVLTEMRDANNDDENDVMKDAYNNALEALREKLVKFTSFMEQISDAMDVLVFWESLYMNLRQLADKFQEVKKNWEIYTEKKRKEARKVIFDGVVRLTEDISDTADIRWTCAGFDFEKEKGVMSDKQPALLEILTNATHRQIWPGVSSSWNDKEMLEYIERNQPNLGELFENLEEVVRPTSPVKGAHSESLRRGGSGGGGGGGREAEDERAAKAKAEAKAAAGEAKAAAEAEAEAEAAGVQDTAAKGEAKAKEEAAKDSQAAEGEGEDEEAVAKAEAERANTAAEVRQSSPAARKGGGEDDGATHEAARRTNVRKGLFSRLWLFRARKPREKKAEQSDKGAKGGVPKSGQ